MRSSPMMKNNAIAPNKQDKNTIRDLSFCLKIDSAPVTEEAIILIPTRTIDIERTGLSKKVLLF